MQNFSPIPANKIKFIKKAFWEALLLALVSEPQGLFSQTVLTWLALGEKEVLPSSPEGEIWEKELGGRTWLWGQEELSELERNLSTSILNLPV